MKAVSIACWRRAAPALAVVLGLPLGALEAQTDHAGAVSGTFAAAGNPHRLTTTCTVPAGQTLTIQAGVILEGQGNTLVVSGTLNGSNATLSSLSVSYRDGSGGTLQNCTVSGGNPIDCLGSSVLNPAAPAITGCTINATSIGIDVSGTARPTLTGNTITANQIALRYFGSSAGAASGNILRFTPEGASSRQALRVQDAASPLVENNTIQDDPTRADIAVSIAVDPASTAIVRSNSVCATGGDELLVFTPGFFAAASTASITGNTFPCSPLAAIGVSGTLAANSTLKPVQGVDDFYLRSTLAVSAGVTLNVPAGAAIQGGNNALTVSGTLNAGSVTFTGVALSYRDGSGGTLQNSTLSGTSPIDLSGSSVAGAAAPAITGCTISATSIGIDVSGTARPTLTGNTVTANNIALRYAGTSAGTASGNTLRFTPEGSSSRQALRVQDGASPLVENNTIQDDPTRADTGITIAVNPASTAIVRSNSVCATGNDEPLAFTPGYFAVSSTASVTGNTFPCSPLTLLRISGTSDTNSTLEPVQGINVFQLTSTLTVSAGAALTVPAGTTIQGSGNTFAVSGTLNAAGVTFTGVALGYRDGSGGTLQNSTLSGSNPIDLSGSSVVTPAAPAITGCRITATSIGIDVSGNARPALSGNTITANQIALRYAGTSGGTASGNTLRFTPGGANSRQGLRVQDAASPLVENNAIEDDPARADTGITIAVNPASTAIVRSNSICATGNDEPLAFTPGYFAAAAAASVTGNTFPCSSLTALRISGTADADSQLEPVQGVGAFVLSSTITVSAGVTLTIPAATPVTGNGNTLAVNGTLNAAGATLSHIFLSFRAGSGGELADCVLRATPLGDAVSVNGALVSLRRNRFEGLGTAVSVLGAATVLLEDNLFLRNTTGIEVQTAVAAVTSRRNRFESNGASLNLTSFPALFSAFPAEFASGTFVGGGPANAIRLPTSGNLNESGTLQSAPVPYQSGGVNIALGQTLVVEPGVVLQFTSSAGLTANGELVAAGTDDHPVVFTSSNPKAGVRWGGLTIRNKQSGLATSILRRAVVEFATTGITLENASIPIEDCTVTDNAGPGILASAGSNPTIDGCRVVQNGLHGIQAQSGSRPIIRASDIFGNAGGGVQNDTASLVLAAEGNFWGDDTGPRDLASDARCSLLSNVNGSGDEVSDCVDYDPWLRIGPSVAGTLRVVSGGGQAGPPGTVLPQPLVVEARSTLNSPIQGILTIFSIVEGDAEIVEAMPVATAANGRAQATVRLGSAPGPIFIAVTARDVDSPLATFLGEASAPCLIEMKIVPETSISGYLHGSPVECALHVRPFLAAAGGSGRVPGEEATVFAGATRISALEGTLENAGALSPAPAAAVGNDLYLRAVYVEAASEDPGLRRLYVSLEGGVNAHGSGGIADLASRVGELAGEQAAARGAEVMEVELTAELKGLEAPGFAWLEAITADSRLEHYDTLLSGHDPARRSLRLLSEQWARLGGEPPGAGARAVGGGSMACTGEEGLSFSLRVRSATLTEDLAGDTALRWVLTLRERAPAGIVCLPGALLDAAWLARLVDEGAVSEATAAQLGESIARVRDLQAAVHAVTGSPAREATLLDLDAALTALAAAVVESEGLSAQVRDQIAAFIGAARAEVARALEAHDPGVRGGHVPGDLNGDLEVNLTDPYQLLGHLFLGDPPAASLPCGGETADGAAAEPSGRQLLDFNGDGVVNLTDPLAQLNHLFRGGPPHVLGPLDRCVRIEGCDGPCR